MKDKRLQKAKGLLKKGRNDEVINLLEKEIFQYREHGEFYYILGMACLNSRDISGADSYLRRAVQLDTENPNPKLALAAILLRKHKTAEAIKIWLTILDIDPSHRKAKRGLQYMKRYGDPKNLSAFLQTRKYKTLFPRIDEHRTRRRILWVLAVLILGLLLGTGGYYRWQNQSQKESRRPEVASVVLPQGESLTARKGEFQLMLTPAEVESTFARAKELLAEYRDNQARYHLNRLLASNASSKVKAQAEVLIGMLDQNPSFSSLKTQFSYRDVAQAPYLYEGCYVAWKGSLSNLDIFRDKITFDFLVGYHDQKVLEGIVPVEFLFAVDIEPEYPLEVLGRIILKKDRFILRGKSVHPLMPPSEDDS